MDQYTFSRSDIAGLEKQYRTNLINSVSGFKSASLIGSANAEGKTNLAVFSQIIHVGADPPLVGVLFRPHTVPRHTLENILATRAFTINHIQEEFLIHAHHCSARWDESEFEACRFTPEYRDSVSAPFVQEASVKVGLTYVEHYTLRCNATVLVVGEIREVLLPAECLSDDGFVDLVKAQTLTCSGLDAYHRVHPPVRLNYAKPRQPVTQKKS